MDAMEQNKLIGEVTKVVTEGLDRAKDFSVSLDRRLTVIDFQLTEIKKDVDQIRDEFKNGDGGSLKEQLAVLKFQVRQHGKIIWLVGTSAVTALAGAAWSLLQQRL